MPAKGIHAFKDFADGWVVEYNEISANVYGVAVGNSSVVRNNYIHHNVGDPNSLTAALRGGGYLTFRSNAVTFDQNEIAWNGQEQKVTHCIGCTFKRNVVHHNKYGIWFDGDNVESLIEDNIVEDNTADAIFYEVSGPGVIRNNTTRRNGGSGVMVSGSQQVEVYQHRSEDDFRGLQYFFRCDRLGETVYADLRNNSMHHNAVVVKAASNIFAATLFLSNCTADQIAHYTTTANNAYSDNQYIAPSVAAKYWAWGPFSATKTFSDWQALGQDVSGSVVVRIQ
jgi:parallel beta-helix repeat protein